MARNLILNHYRRASTVSLDALRAAQGLIQESELRAARLDLRRMELARRLAELKLRQMRGGGGKGR